MIDCDITITGGGYVACINSKLGGTCFRLTHPESSAELLRTPKDEAERSENVFLYGNPILFPCNRIRCGKFTFEGREYLFPVNEPATGCHIHGGLYDLLFAVEKLSENEVVLSYSAQAGEYLGFPHAFTLKRIYTLDEKGLAERVEIYNHSGRNMPFTLAFHTTFNLPFTTGEKASECCLYLPVGWEQVRDERYLPVLKWRENGAREKAMRRGEFRPFGEAVSALYKSDSRMRLVEPSEGLALCYEGDKEYAYRMVWRGKDSRFLVVEPQTCAIDCFHLDTPAEENGLIVIPPNGMKALKTRMYIAKTE